MRNEIGNGRPVIGDDDAQARAWHLATVRLRAIRLGRAASAAERREMSVSSMKRDGMSIDARRKPAAVMLSRSVAARTLAYAETVPPAFTKSTVPRHAVDFLGTTKLPECGRERISPSRPSCFTTAAETIIDTPNSSHISRHVGKCSPPARRPSAMAALYPSQICFVSDFAINLSMANNPCIKIHLKRL